MKTTICLIITAWLALLCLPMLAQSDTTTYHLTIRDEMVKKAGKQVMGMTINGEIPGPTLRFKDGGYAVIYVKNEMKMETSIHWHGLLLPNFYDGVPYLTTPPIEPGQTLKYEFPLKQSGTYWYHSHTMLQEQSGVYGSIVIEPKEKTLDYNKDLVLVLSDWTNENPNTVLRNLKRGTEWYNLRKSTATPLNKVIAGGAFGAQMSFWRQRMEGADIADVYYPAFLVNGAQSQEYADFNAGDKVRLRIVNGSASTSFWMTFGGEDPLLVSADGPDVVPVKHNKTFIAVAETYDFIVTIPPTGKLEFRATAQDGSGTTSAFIGKGQTLVAPEVPKPDYIALMKEMANMNMNMGAPGMKFKPKHDDPGEFASKWGMDMSGEMHMEGGQQTGHGHANQVQTGADPDMKMEMDTMAMPMDHMHHIDTTAMQQGPEHTMDEMNMDQGMQGMDHGHEGHMTMEVSPAMDMPIDSAQNMAGHEHMHHDNMDMTGMDQEDKMDEMTMASSDTSAMPSMHGMNMFAEYNYDFLKSPMETTYPKDAPLHEILLNLTGNMQRYVWSMNGIPLSETDKIKIKRGEITRITFNNLTMMHHPMHLHGHFFRVLNENGPYSPLKHTVNVPPMQQLTIEFYGNESGDWFFHCHILYHMMSGMARVFSYDTPPDPRMEEYPISNLIQEADRYYTWGLVDAASHMTSINLVSSNIRNQFNYSLEYGWNKNLETEFTYERYLYDYFSVFAGVNIENNKKNSLDNLKTTAVAGFRFLTPYLFNLDVRIDSDLRPRVGIGRSIMLFPKFSAFGYYEYQGDFGWVNNLEGNSNFKKEIVWNTGAEYMLSRNLSLTASYDNRFGGGGGVSIRF